MAPKAVMVASLLTYIQDAAARHKTNAYQITKATGIPLHSVQKLLQQTSNPTLKNIHLLLDGFGVELYAIDTGKPLIRPAWRLSGLIANCDRLH